MQKLNIHGYEFQMNPVHDMVVLSMNNGKKWEHHSLKLWTEKVKQTDGIILDVGAYTGIYTLLANAVNGDDSPRKIYAFEPLKRIYSRLQENVHTNIQFNKNVVLVNIGLSNKNESIELSITNNIPLPSGSSLNPTKTVKAVEKIEVYSGDYWFRNDRDKIGLVKIDVEHHEEEVLEGMVQNLKETKPVCFIEILDKQKLFSILNFMKNVGYTTCHHIDDEKEQLTEISFDVSLQELNDFNATGGMNYIFELGE